jgi:hypothetical protein
LAISPGDSLSERNDFENHALRVWAGQDFRLGDPIISRKFLFSLLGRQEWEKAIEGENANFLACGDLDRPGSSDEKRIAGLVLGPTTLLDLDNFDF